MLRPRYKLIIGLVLFCGHGICQVPTGIRNYVMETFVKVPGKTNASMLNGLPVEQANRTVLYLDGLGRSLQTVSWQGSPLKKDIVQIFEYDAFGRETKKYLPYADYTANDASFKSSGTSSLGNFYSLGSGWDANVVKTSYPYSQAVLEPSPLNRATEQGFPGGAWQPYNVSIGGSGHTTKSAYATNVLGDAVKLWAVSPSGAASARNYPAGSLYKNVFRDENWVSGLSGTIEEFKDTRERLVLKRTWASETVALDTYYVYDVYGNLAYVVPPAVVVTSFTEADASFRDFIYGYHYDGRNRIIEKKAPGRGWEFMVYNTLDQEVLRQDSVQRANGQWSFIKYDALGRTVATGLYSNSAGRVALQTLLDGQSKLWETRSGAGYDGLSFPQSGGVVLSLSYYDGYNFGVTIPPSVTVSARARGLLTGTRVYQTDGTLPRWTVYYYDEEARARENIAENHLGGADRYISNHNFAGELTSSTRLHVALGNTTVIDNAYAYDHTGRQLSSRMNVNSLGEVVLNSLSYNEIGQLRQKQLHRDTVGGSFLHTGRYARNERGWLKDIASKEFSFKLGYDTLASPQYNGNISTQLWGAGSSYPNRFLYTYDKLNRLASGASTGVAMVEEMTYDAMGNIKTLSRDYGTANSYFYNGNRLSHVDGVTNPYSYDANGNATIDGRMNLTQTYNHLNLLKHATTTGLNVYYTYNALGVKLKREVLASGTVTTDYVDGIHYTNGAIDFIQTGEGRARKSGSSYVYEYNLTDHLGNVRYSFDKDAGIARKLQADDYYPFGLRKVATLGSNAYLYNSKELQSELGKYDYGARLYDPVIGRWNVVDPSAEKYYSMSPYVYAANNPIFYIDPDGREIDPASKKEWERQKQAVINQRDKLQGKMDKLSTQAEKKSWGTEKLANKMGNLGERVSSLNSSIVNFVTLESSSQIYSLSKIGGTENGGVTYDSKTGNVVISFGGTANFVHETTHAGQFETGGIAFSSNGQTLGQDVFDEVAGYKAQFAYNPSSISGLSSTSVANSFGGITPQWLQGIRDPNGNFPYAPGGSANTGLVPVNINSNRDTLIRAYPRAAGAFNGLPANYTLKLIPGAYYKK
jgi:RHS repeat-associated protein